MITAVYRVLEENRQSGADEHRSRDVGVDPEEGYAVEAIYSEFTCDICLSNIPDTLEFISLSHYTELHEPDDVIQPLFVEWSLISCTACAKEKDLTGVVKQLGENVEGQLRRVSI